MLKRPTRRQLGYLGFLWILGPLGLITGQPFFFGFFFFGLFGVFALLDMLINKE